jgi:PAS domain S-box-containing protein
MILHVENDTGRHAAVEQLLQQAGFSVIWAATGGEALQRAAEVLPQIILLGVTLPDISGPEFCRRLKTNPTTASIPIISCSAFSLPSHDEDKSSESGTLYYLSSHKEPQDLIATIQALHNIQQREEALRKSEERFRLIARTTNDVLWDWDLRTDASWWSEGTHRLFDYPAEAVRPHASWWYENLHPEDRDRVSASLRAVIEGGGRYWEDEYRFRRGDGSYAVVLDRGEVVQDATGNPIRMVGAMKDITASKQTEEALMQRTAELQREIVARQHVERTLRQNEALLQAILHHTQVAIYIKDLNGRYLLDNHQHQLLTGLRGEEIRGKTDAEVFPPDIAAQFQQNDQKVLASAHPIEFEEESRLADGLHTYLSAKFPLTDAAGVPYAIGGVSLDTTAYTQATAALRASEERYRLLFENASDVIATFTLDETIISVNRGAEVLLGWTREEVMGQHVSKVVTPASIAAAQERTRRWLAGEKLPSVFEIELLGKDGGVVPVEARVRVIRDGSGQPAGFQGIFRDITMRKETELALRQAKNAAEAANRTKSEFLATMSHELRTPLNIIIGYSDILLDRDYGELTPEQEDILRRINGNAQELHDLITAVLDVSRLEGERFPLNLSQVEVATIIGDVERETRDLRAQSNLEFVWKVALRLPPVRTDEGKLKVVLKNLVGNAIKFTPAGRVTVEASARESGIVISVADTGIGMALHEVTQIFEPFHQLNHPSGSHQKGTGLGLYIVKRLLDLLGGTISVESQVGQGSTFTVWLPSGE